MYSDLALNHSESQPLRGADGYFDPWGPACCVWFLRGAARGPASDTVSNRLRLTCLGLTAAERFDLSPRQQSGQ